MAEYVESLVVNFSADGKFASATQRRAGVMQEIDGVEVEIPQPNESVDLFAVQALLKGA